MTYRFWMALLGSGLLTLSAFSSGYALEPCCNITAIAGNLVSATETATGKPFQSHVPNQALAKSLRVGQKIHADFTSMKVSVQPDGAEPCCNIVSAADGAPSGAALPGIKTPTIHAAEPCCSVTINAALKGRLGRLVLAFPADALPKGTRVAVLKDGKELNKGYGSQTWDLLPGTYEVSISGKLVSNVTVQARHDTVVKVGVLRVSAGQQTRVAVIDGGKEIAAGHGNQVIGLPLGSFAVRVGGQTENVTIGAGQITDF